jgi:hypothetical protein
MRWVATVAIVTGQLGVVEAWLDAVDRAAASGPRGRKGRGQPCARTCSVTSWATRSGASSGMKWGTPSSTSSR